MHLALVFALLLAAAVFFQVRAEFRRNELIVRATKVPSTVLVFGFGLASLQNPSTYSIGIAAGLGFCVAGDAAMMFHRRPGLFAAGLALFLAAQAVFAAAMHGSAGAGAGDLPLGLALFAAGTAFFAVARAGAGGLRPAVLAYIVVICLMVHRAVALLWSPGVSPGRASAAAVGALLFWVSDLILAWNKFVKPLARHEVSLAFYYAGIYCLALSTHL